MTLLSHKTKVHSLSRRLQFLSVILLLLFHSSAPNLAIDTLNQKYFENKIINTKVSNQQASNYSSPLPFSRLGNFQQKLIPREGTRHFFSPSDQSTAKKGNEEQGGTTEPFSVGTTNWNLSLRWNRSLGQVGFRETRSIPVVADIDADGNQEIFIMSISGEQKGYMLRCLRSDGSTRWGRNFYNESTYSEEITWYPTVVNLDGDDEPELLLGGRGVPFSVACLSAADGTLKWDKKLEAGVWESVMPIRFHSPQEKTNGGNRSFNLIVVTNTAGIYCLDPSGDILWHQSLESEEEYSNGKHCCTYSPPALADFNNDSLPEIIVFGYYSEGQTYPTHDRCYYFCLNGTTGEVIRYVKLTERHSEAPTVADLDGDGAQEIVYTTGTFFDTRFIWLIVLNAYGEIQHRQKLFSDEQYHGWDNHPVIADLNDDGQLEILVATEPGALHCYSANLTLLWKYQTKGWLEECRPIVADLNNDGQMEILFTNSQDIPYKSTLYLLNNKGELLWSFYTPYGLGRFSDFAIADLENDGRLEIVCAQFKPCNLLCFELPSEITASGVASCPCYRGSLFRNGWGDSDGDFIDDFTETQAFSTDPQNADSDGDGFSDGEEYLAGTDPLDSQDYPRKLFWFILKIARYSVGGTATVAVVVTLLVTARRRRKRKNHKRTKEED
ncbi:MAG: hypothetical protein GF308_08830 [Candidatus Heimdallarchaeota archaeon]|nr:hypothetical protein [Candidatus Heimdallarchaeota archaeon]